MVGYKRMLYYDVKLPVFILKRRVFFTKRNRTALANAAWNADTTEILTPTTFNALSRLLDIGNHIFARSLVLCYFGDGRFTRIVLVRMSCKYFDSTEILAVD
jgi:hypothetical protein